MATPVENIAAGLPSVARKPVPGLTGRTLPSELISIVECKALAHGAEKAAAAYRAHAVKLNADLAAARERAYADAGRYSHLSKSDRETLARKAYESDRAEIIKNSEPERLRLLKVLTGIRDKAERALPFYDSAAKILMRDRGLTERGLALAQRLQSSGPAEILNFAAVAHAQRDGELAAAILNRHSTMNTRDRDAVALDRDELARSCVPDFDELQSCFAVVRNRAREVVAEDRQFARGSRGSIGDEGVDAIQRALDAGAEQHFEREGA